MDEEIMSVSGDELENVLKTNKKVVVDFFAPWCGPCKSLAKIIKEIAPKFEGKVLFVKVNLDENGDKLSGYTISSIPTVMCFDDAKQVNTMVGLRDKKTFQDFIETSLKLT